MTTKQLNHGQNRGSHDSFTRQHTGTLKHSPSNIDLSLGTIMIFFDLIINLRWSSCSDDKASMTSSEHCVCVFQEVVSVLPCQPGRETAAAHNGPKHWSHLSSCFFSYRKHHEIHPLLAQTNNKLYEKMWIKRVGNIISFFFLTDCNLFGIVTLLIRVMLLEIN